MFVNLYKIPNKGRKASSNIIENICVTLLNIISAFGEHFKSSSSAYFFPLSVFKQSDVPFPIKSDKYIMKDSFGYYAVKK